MTRLAHPTLAITLAMLTYLPNFAEAKVPPPRASDRVEDRCDAAATQAETEVCYLDAGKKMRIEMEIAFERNLRTAEALDRDFNAYAKSKNIPRSTMVQDLKASQSAWLRYSRSQCLFEGDPVHGGSGTDIFKARCLYRLNSLRLSELRASGRLLDFYR